VLAAGCSAGSQTQDDLQVAPTLVAATAAASPHPSVAPAGVVIAQHANTTAVVIDATTKTLAVAVADPPTLLLYSLADPHAQPRSLPLPGRVDHLDLTRPGGPLLAAVPTANQVVQIAMTNRTTTAVVPVPGGPTSAIQTGDTLLVAVPGQHAVDVVDARSGKVTKTITGDVNPEQVITAGGHALLLDQLRSALFDVDAVGGSVGAGQRAGGGATNADTDRYGRVLVTDTRYGELLAFSTGPVLLRQRYPVPGAPYGIAVDKRRDLAWVTLTSVNQVVGYDIAGGQPVEKYRLATVRQPNSVAVDPDSGQVIVASAEGGGIQVISP
jgi:DNA-binding beta-propeller fold protein YncE